MIRGWFTACICLDQISDATRHVGACWCSRERHGACCFNRAQIAVLNTGLFCVLMPNGGIGRRVIMTCKICGGVDNGSIGYSQGCFQVSSMQVSTRIRGKAIKQVAFISSYMVIMVWCWILNIDIRGLGVLWNSAISCFYTTGYPEAQSTWTWHLDWQKSHVAEFDLQFRSASWGNWVLYSPNSEILARTAICNPY